MKLYGRRPARGHECFRDLSPGAQRATLPVLTNKDGAEEQGDGDVDDGSRHVEKPVRSHGEESQEEQKEEQTVLVVLNLEDMRTMALTAGVNIYDTCVVNIY